MADLERKDDPLAGLTAPDERARIAAVRACGRARDPGPLALLRKLAGEDPSVEVRYQARVALNVIREAQVEAGDRAAGNFPGDPTAAQLRLALASANPAERVWALRESVLHDDAPSLVAVVVSRVPLEKVPDVRAQLVTTLAEMGGKQVRVHVAALLADPDARVRANAVEAAETLGDPELPVLLVKALQDSDHRVKLNAVTALDRLGKLSLLRCCARMMRDRDYWVRDAATYNLAAARLPGAVPVLVRALNDPHEPVRVKAREGLVALSEVGVTAARDALARSAAPAAPDQGWDAGLAPLIAAAEPAAEEGHIPLILERLRTEADPRILIRLLAMLGALGNGVVVPIVFEFSNHSDAAVTRSSGEALRRLGAGHLVLAARDAAENDAAT